MKIAIIVILCVGFYGFVGFYITQKIDLFLSKSTTFPEEADQISRKDILVCGRGKYASEITEYLSSKCISYRYCSDIAEMKRGGCYTVIMVVDETDVQNRRIYTYCKHAMKTDRYVIVCNESENKSFRASDKVTVVSAKTMPEVAEEAIQGIIGGYVA